MKFKRGISLALALALIAGIGGPLDIRAAAADTGSSDALAALGIDSSKAPDGFNANAPQQPIRAQYHQGYAGVRAVYRWSDE